MLAVFSRVNLRQSSVMELLLSDKSLEGKGLFAPEMATMIF